MIRYRLSASVLALIASTGLAQAEAYDLGVLTLYSSQTPLTLGETGSTVTIVEKEDLDDAPTTSVADYLSTVPGVSVATNGGIGTQSAIRIRGLGGAYVPVLINGIDVTDPSSTQTQFDWGALTLGTVDRIEVLQGTQSALYGSEAIGGVVNITTLNPEAEAGTHGSYGLEVGGNAMRRANFGLAHSGARGGIALTAAYTQTDGFSASTHGKEDDGFTGTQLTLEGYYDVTDTVRLGASLLYMDSEGEFDPASGDGAQPYNEVNTSTSHGARIYAQFDLGSIDSELSYSEYVLERELTQENWFDPSLDDTYEYKGTRKTVSYVGRQDLSETFSHAYGLDWTREGYGQIDEAVETYGLFYEGVWTPSDTFTFVGSLRHDRHSKFGNFTSGRLAFSYDIGNDTILRATAANGFRAPSLYELYGPWVGNSDLNPETSQSYEIGLEKSYANGSLSATFFYTQIDDLIDYDFATSSYNQVPGVSKTRGLMLAGTYDLSDRVSLYGNYTLTETEAADGGRMPRTPKHDLTLGVMADVTDALSMGMTVKHVADLSRENVFSTQAADDYTLVNASVSYDIAAQSEVYLRVENLTDADYHTLVDYNTPGRTVFFGVRGSF